jgi:hypothetical protein
MVSGTVRHEDMDEDMDYELYSHRADASYYQQHKDDPELWGEPEESPPTPPDHVLISVTVRFPPRRPTCCANLQKAGLPYSEFVRQAVRQYAQSHVVTDSVPVGAKK